MALQILRKGSEGKEVKRWQNFLIGQGHLRARADGDFGPLTEKATKAFQRSQGLSSDGIVGPQTLGSALLLGFDAGFEDRVEPETNPVLVGAPSIRPATARTRNACLAAFAMNLHPRREIPSVSRSWMTGRARIFKRSLYRS